MSSSYAQYCPVARALEVVGERWTVLVARELLFGPRRFTDLQVGLPGISTTVLTSRLKELEEAGLVTRRTLPAPAASVVYELTASAWGLVSVLATMAEWGRDLLGEPRPDDDVRSAWLILALAVTAKAPEPLTDGTFELRIEGEGAEGGVFHIQCRDGHCQPHEGPADRADAVITMAHSTLLDLASGGLDVRARTTEKLIKIEGDAVAARRLVESLGRSAA